MAMALGDNAELDRLFAVRERLFSCPAWVGHFREEVDAAVAPACKDAHFWREMRRICADVLFGALVERSEIVSATALVLSVLGIEEQRGERIVMFLYVSNLVELRHWREGDGSSHEYLLPGRWLEDVFDQMAADERIRSVLGLPVEPETEEGR